MFLEQFARKMNRPMKMIDQGAAKLLTEYSWPGNVRELRNLMEWVTVMFPGSDLIPEQLQKIVILPAQETAPVTSGVSTAGVHLNQGDGAANSLARRTDNIIQEALARNRGNQKRRCPGTGHFAADLVLSFGTIEVTVGE